MTGSAAPSKDSTSSDRYQLWVDGCGGYLLLLGHRWTVGGPSSAHNIVASNRSVDKKSAVADQRPADVSVLADWPTIAGEIKREGPDYWWLDQASITSTSTSKALGTTKGGMPANESPADRHLLSDQATLPIGGSATMALSRPNPLSATVRLDLRPPHRFVGHYDHVLLVDQHILVGPGTDAHLRTDQIDQPVVIFRRNHTWMLKPVSASETVEIAIGSRTQFQNLALTMDVV